MSERNVPPFEGNLVDGCRKSVYLARTCSEVSNITKRQSDGSHLGLAVGLVLY